MLDATTKRKIDSARQILVGKVPNPTAQVEQITAALIYKFMDDMDKEARELGGKAKFFTNGFAKYSWTKLLDKRLSGQERLDLYVQAIANIPKNERIPELFRDIFAKMHLPFYDQETLNMFLKEIDGFNYDHSENLGDAYEYLLSVLGTQKKLGQLRTPRHIIDFIVEIVEPKKNETILDPACGTAGFLISAYKYILKHNSSNFKPEKEEAKDKIKKGKTAAETILKTKEEYSGDLLTPTEKKKIMSNIVGYDIDPTMKKLSLANMYLHGFPNPRIYEYDSLTYEDRWNETFDVIMANPPFFSPKGGIRPHKKFSVKSSRAEVLFVDYILEHLNLKGRAGIIVPEGIVFKNENVYKQLRQMLIEDGLFAVVSLPPGAFNPYSGIRTNILFFDNQFAKRVDEILFLKIENDGFDLGAQRRKIDKNDLPEALEILQLWKKNKKQKSDLALWVKKDRIAERGLPAPRPTTYVIRCNDDSFYIGQTSNMYKRWHEHKQGLVDWTKKHKPLKIIHYEEFDTQQEAIKREKDLKTGFGRKWLKREYKAGRLNKWSKSTARQAGDYNLTGERYKEVELRKNQKWPLIELQEVAEIDWGNTELTKNAYDEKGGFLGVSASGCDGRMNHFEHEVGVTVLSAIGANCGRVFYPTEKFTAIKNTITFTPDHKKLEPKYLFYIMKNNTLPKRGGGQPFMSKGDVEKYKIPLPPLEVQKEIVEQIEVKQNAINHAKEIIKDLEREKRYFGQEIKKLEGVELVQLGDVLNHEQPTKYIVKSTNYKDEYKTPVLTAGQTFILGYTEEEDGVFPAENLPVIIFDDFTTANKFVDFPFKVKSSAMKILSVKDKNKADIKFVFLVMQDIEFDASTHKRYWIAEYSKIKIPLPPIGVQKQLVAEMKEQEKVIEANKKLVSIMEQKIVDVLAKI